MLFRSGIYESQYPNYDVTWERARKYNVCMGAALNARVDKLYFGAKEQKGRSLTGELAAANLLNHPMEVRGGVLEEECSEILTEFFTALRARLKAEKEERAEQRKKLAENEQISQN